MFLDSLRFLNRAPKDKDKRKIDKAFAEADPTSYSALISKNLTYVGGNEYGYSMYEDEYGTRYIELKDKPGQSGPAEAIVSSLLKGIVNVSDVVVHKRGDFTGYYSKVMELDKTKNISYQEMVADVLLLKLVFKDEDRELEENRTYDHNLVRDKKKKKIVYFDFGGAKNNFWSSWSRSPLQLWELDATGLAFLRKKTLALKDRLSGQRGREFLAKVVSHIGTDIARAFPISNGPKDEDIFYETLINRLETILEVIDKKDTGLRKAA
jgi:hypothetical protein